MSNEPAPFKEAPPPFSGAIDADTDGHPSDFILRSCDGVDFHVHREILKFASDCFDGMFSFPGGDGDTKALFRDGKPILVLPESESVLYRLLCLAYPAYALEPYTLGAADLDGLVAARQAAHKYQFIRVQRLLECMLYNPSLIHTQPHRVFAIARLWDLPDLARKAALSTLKYAVYPSPSAFPEMKLLAWEEAHKLHTFHHSCGTAAKGIAELHAASEGLLGLLKLENNPSSLSTSFQNVNTKQDFVWWASKDHSAQCRNPDSALIRGLRRTPVAWFQRHISRLAAHLYLVPSQDTVAAQVLTLTPADRATIDTCPQCSERATRDLAALASQLAIDIEASNNSLADLML
ncbi:hypothetical protein B0H19DRAFT_1014770 [Mycena capillaripes]|nr:hypothetical protein B0H19DRAFT_1014770 [Mycena capillaripes]